MKSKGVELLQRLTDAHAVFRDFVIALIIINPVTGPVGLQVFLHPSPGLGFPVADEFRQGIRVCWLRHLDFITAITHRKCQP